MEAAAAAAVEAAAAAAAAVRTLALPKGFTQRRRGIGGGGGGGGGVRYICLIVLEVRLRRTRLEAYRIARGPISSCLIARMPPLRSAIATSDSLSSEPAERSASRGANARS